MPTVPSPSKSGGHGPGRFITNQSAPPPHTPGRRRGRRVAGRSRRRHTARAGGGYDELPDQARIPQQPSTLRRGRYQRRNLLRLVDLSVVSSSPSNAQPPTASNASHTTVTNSVRMGPTFPQAHYTRNFAVLFARGYQRRQLRRKPVSGHAHRGTELWAAARAE